MGDTRFERPYERVREAPDRQDAIRSLRDDELIAALAAASRHGDPYLANVLATETQNRVGQKTKLLDHMGDGVYVVDEDGIVLTANPQVARLLGRPAETLVGQDMHALSACACDEAADRSRASCPAIRTAREGRPRECDALYRRADGTDALLSIIATPLHAHSEPPRAVVVLRDVAERRRAEQAAQHLAAIVRSSEDAILTKAPDGAILAWNPAAERLFGYTAEEAVGRDEARLLVPPELRDEEAALLARVAQGEPVRRRETRRVRKDGAMLTVSLSLSPIRDARGRVTGIACIARDVSDAKRWQAALAESEARFRLAAKATHDVVWDYVPGTDELWWSDNLLTLLGYGRGGIPRTFQAWADLVHPADRERARGSAEAWLYASTKEEWSEEYRMRRADGSYAHVLDRAHVIRRADGWPVRVVGSLADVTAQRAMEAATHEALAREREARAAAQRRLRVWLVPLAWGAGTMITLRTLLLAWFALPPQEDVVTASVVSTLASLAAGAAAGALAYASQRRRWPAGRPRGA